MAIIREREMSVAELSAMARNHKFDEIRWLATRELKRRGVAA